MGSESEQTRRPVIIFMSLELGGGGGGASGLKRGGCNRLLIICLRITAHLFTNATMQCHKNVQLREAVVTAHLRIADAVVTAP